MPLNSSLIVGLHLIEPARQSVRVLTAPELEPDFGALGTVVVRWTLAGLGGGAE